MSTFRLATLNVHLFEDGSKRQNNIDQLVSIIEPLHLDFIAVQEIANNRKWTNFCETLSFPHFIYGPNVGDHFGNGIASRYPIRSSKNEISKYLCRGGTRSILQCYLDHPHSSFQNRSIAVTHLDPFDEDDRLIQINHFNPSKQNIDILLGDMNALTRDDYSDEYYHQRVVQSRQKSQWESPRFDLTQLLTQQWNYQDAFKVMNSNSKDEQIQTCNYGTRIDYIYVHPRVNDQWTLTECSSIDTKGATDHNLVLAQFQID